MKIQVFRNNATTIELPLYSATFTKKLMAEHELVFSFQSPEVLDIEVGDYLTYDGEVMTINKSSDVLRNHLLEYNITFQGNRHTLERFIIKDEGSLTFDYTADLETYMFMFLESINSVDSGWTLGDIDEIEPFTLTFDKVDHLTALNMIAEGAACEFQFIGKQIIVKKTVGIAREYPLAYGKDNGLYSVARKSLENSKIVTRAYAVGGSQNLPQSYPHRQLTLPGYIEDATAVALYRIREGVFEDQNIYPQRTGTATSVGQINEATFTLTDTTIDFDLNGQMIEGSEAKIVFKSGALNGQEFKILAYNHTSKTIRYEANKDSNGNLTPFGLYVAEVGDQYTLVGIRMPESYVNAALSELETKRLEYLNSNKVPRVVYDASVDPLDLKRKAGVINEGDILPFTDDKIGLDDNLRVTSISYNALLPYQLVQGMTFDIEIGQEVTYTRLQKVEKDIKETKEVVTQVSRTSAENDRRNAAALQEFKSMVFDPDGNMQEPLLEAIAGVFGTTSQYYDLSGVQITVNAGGDENAIELTAGTLIHRVYKIDGLGYIWNLTVFSESGLDPLKAYYLSAKCSKTALTGEWVLSDTQMGTDDEPGYWHFNLGVLSSVIEGARSFRPTKLYTVISGGQIETNTLTAYMIDVQRLFAQYIEAENFWLKIGKIGIFDVAEGQIRTENWNNGTNNDGVRFTNNGILSRNANESLFPGAPGIDYAGSLVGMLDKPLPAQQDSFGMYARAGQMGINYRDMDIDAMNQLIWCWGQYGGLFSSLKVLGGVELPARIMEGSGTVQVKDGDYTLIIAGNHTAVDFPESPNHGKILVIKNSRSVDITITAGTGHNFIFADNSQANTAVVPAAKYRTYQFVRQLLTAGYWVEIGAVT